ncbi:hypothetical protein GCT13_24855 [Paraburkholderia sp. CNPSo 3157]|uniref:Uncharacterized protein n=2 Tax=Paraburkholderia franconis TaxID=2654983 RepID=A0A7X1NDM6_9BURK|nr:hypothetical protein [Paraburkholderia franconis]
MMTRQRFEQQLAALLQRWPVGTTADLSDCIVAYWNGHQITYAFLCDNESGQVDEEFDVDDYVWDECRPVFEEWLAEPTFTLRDEVKRWLADAPPFEEGR